MTKKFGRIFWGLLFVILDISINQFDLLPDFIGYILVAVGARGLVATSSRFGTASTLSWILTLLSLMGFFTSGDVATLLGIVNLIVDCAMMWTLLGGVIEFTASNDRLDLAERASHRRIAYVVLLCTVTFIGFLGRGAPVVIMAVTLVVLVIMILHLIHRVRYEVAQ